MNQPNSGQTNLDEQLDKILDEYEGANNLKFPAFTHDISSYWNMSRDYIESLSRNDREEIAMQLAQHSMYVQRLYNRERARVKFCNASLSNIYAGEWQNYQHIFKDEMKMAAIARENSAAAKLLKVKNHAEIRVQDLEGLPKIIDHLSDLLMRSAYGKD